MLILRRLINFLTGGDDDELYSVDEETSLVMD